MKETRRDNINKWNQQLKLTCYAFYASKSKCEIQAHKIIRMSFDSRFMIFFRLRQITGVVNAFANEQTKTGKTHRPMDRNLIFFFFFWKIDEMQTINDVCVARAVFFYISLYPTRCYKIMENKTFLFFVATNEADDFSLPFHLNVTTNVWKLWKVAMRNGVNERKWPNNRKS